MPRPLPALRRAHRLALLFALALVGCTSDGTDATVVGWNIEGVGAPGTPEFVAAVQVLRVLDPDVVAIAEVAGAGDAPNLLALADALGFEHVVQADGAPFGALRTAVISRWPFVETAVLDSAALSGDGAANDISRHVVVAVVAVPDALPLTVMPVHLKSGGANTDQFRRAVESARFVQALGGLDPARAAYVVLGDFNEEIDRVPRTPEVFRDVPAGMPGAFSLGADIDGRLVVAGLLNDPFAPLLDAAGPAMALLDAAKRDGDRGTRPSSGRRLDYALVSPALAADARAALYASDDLDRHLDPAPAPFGASADASDHLPVVVDLRVPPVCSFDRDCDDGLWCTGEARCVGGRCVPDPPCRGACDEERDRCR